MKLRNAVVPIVCAMVAAIAVGAGGPTAGPAPSETEQLRRQVAALEIRVAALEERLSRDPERAEGRRRPPTGGCVIPRLAPSMPALPEGWQQREFNGMPYYVVPVQEAQRTTIQPAR